MSQSSPRVLVVVQHDGTHCSTSTLSTLTAAQQLSTLCAKCPIDALLVGYQCQPVCQELQQLGVINQVILVDDEWYVHPLSERIAPVVAEVSQRYSHVLSSATTFGKDLMPRVAALLDVGQLSDITAIESADTIIRPIYAGNAYVRVQSNDPIKVMTIRESAFDNIEPVEGSTTVTRLQRVTSPISTEFVGQVMTESARPDLTSAKVVVSGGRGLGSKEHFALVETLADKLGGAIGASRAAVDAGFVSNDLQVGQTGKVVAPDLYIAVGISGAIQHIAGMKESKVIVAINSDPDAPIFEVADYGLVGDLFTIVPELIENL